MAKQRQVDGLTEAEAEALFGRRVKLHYWAGSPRFLNDTSGWVRGWYDPKDTGRRSSIEVVNRPIRLPGMGRSAMSTVVGVAEVALVEVR
jgi:hypothetical protein